VIAIDSSSWIAFFSGSEPGEDDVEIVSSALDDRQACLPPVVLTELLSDPKLPRTLTALLVALPRLEPLPDYWQRAGLLRAKLLTRKHRARLADTLIAQSCIDHGVRLVTRDADFRHFARVGGLRLAV
jgi:predicted nucleic acid-binding protein